jgi:transcriptional regulator with XRE-family HTH domain
MSQDPEIVFAANVKRERRKIGMSQERLSKESGLSREYIGRLERKVFVNVTMTTAKQIAKALGTTVVALLTPPESRRR